MSFLARLLMGPSIAPQFSPDIISKHIGYPHDNKSAIDEWRERYRIAIQCENMERSLELSRKK